MKMLPGFRERFGFLLHSIRFRIVLWFAAILALVLTVFSGFVYYNQSRDLSGDAVMRLERKMTGLQDALGFALMQTNGKLIISKGVLQDTDIFLWLGPNGGVLANYGPIPPQDAVQLADRGLSEHSQQGNSDANFVAWTETNNTLHDRYLFAITPFIQIQGQMSFAILGTPFDPYGLSKRLFLTLLGGSLLTLAIALGGGFWLANRAMQPVQTITQAARTISETDLNRRLNLKSKDELGELANTFDAMLARLQAAFERQRQFVADASHELRTPLTIVNLETSRALASHRSADEYQHALGIIRSENDFMTSLVNDLLMLARMDAGQAVVEKIPLDLSDLAVETVERLIPLADRYGVSLEGGDLPEAPILGDRQYLIQMISNLVENGIKYTTGKNKRVWLETGSADGNSWVRVSDTGPGIAPEHLPHLFDRFYQIDKARTRGSEDESAPIAPASSGLGLAIVQWIAQMNGGEVRVESELGTGTSFEVRFKVV